MHHRRDCLHCLAKAHLISEQHPLLMEDVLRPERLIRAQIALKAGQIELDRVDLGRELRRDTAVNDRTFDSGRTGLFDKGVVRRRVVLKVLHRGRHIRVDRLVVRRDEMADPLVGDALKEAPHLGRRAGRRLTRRRPGKRPLKAVGDEDARQNALRKSF